MVLIRPIQAERDIDIGGIPNTRVDSSIGEGLQALGGSVQRAGAVLAEIDQRRALMKAQADEFRADQGLRRFGDDMALEFAKQQQAIDPSGEGFTESVSAKFNEKAEQFLQTVPTEFRGKFAELVRTSRETWINKAAAAEIDQRNAWYRDGISKSQESLQGQVFNDPSLFEAALEDGNRAIDSSGLPPVEKEKLKEAWKLTLAQTLGEREIRDAEANPSRAADAGRRLGVAGADPVETVVSKIIGVESGGKANAKNPNSSASGLGQFINSTWLAMVKKYRPDIANGRSSKEILALKNDPALGREMTVRYTQENAAGLRSSGLPVTPGTLYLAHFAGLGGAKAVLRAGASTPVVDVLGPAVVKANGFLSGKTAGWLIDWADGKMKGVKTPSQPADPRYASLPLEDRLKIYDQIQAAAKRGQTAIDAQATATYNAEKGALELGIQTGEVSSTQQILQSNLTDAHKADLLSQLRSRQKDESNVAEAVRLFGQGALSVDPYDSDGKKTVDAVWDKVSKLVAPEMLQQTAEDLVRQTGTLPQSVINEIRKAMMSGNAQEVAMAAQAAQRFAAIDPAALSRRDGGSEVQKIADDFSHYVTRLNLSPDEAARKIMDLRSPDKQRDRKALEPAAKEFLKQMEEIDLAAQFDESFFGWRSNPELGVTPQQEYGIKADFLALAEEAFYQANGEPEVAKNRAVEQMKRLYGVSDLTGKSVVMKHPPERYWPKSTLGVEKEPGRIHGTGAQGPGPAAGSLSIFSSRPRPSLDYALKQLEADVKALDPNVDFSTVQLVTTPETDAMVKRGELPGYAILYRDSAGMYQTIPGKLWRPDISEAVKAEQKRAQDDQDEAIERAREIQSTTRNVIEGLPEALEGSGMQNSPLMSDDPAALERLQTEPETPASQIQGQRRELFDNARQMGTLTPQQALSGADDVFGAR